MKKNLNIYAYSCLLFFSTNLFSYQYDITNLTDHEFDVTFIASNATQETLDQTDQSDWFTYLSPIGAFEACSYLYGNPKHLAAHQSFSVETGYCGIGKIDIGDYNNRYTNDPELGNKSFYIHSTSAGYRVDENPERTDYERNQPILKKASDESKLMEEQAKGGQIDIKYIANKPIDKSLADTLKKQDEAASLKDKAGNSFLHNLVIKNPDFSKIDQLHQTLESAEDMVSAGRLEAKNTQGETPLHIAAKLKSRDWALFFVRHHANVKAVDKYGYTPLHEAAENFDPYIIRLLLFAGADLNAKSNGGQTPFDFVNSFEAIKFFLNKSLVMDRDATLNYPNIYDDKNGKTHLIYVAEAGSQDLFDKLVKLGADVNFADKEGRTPLAVALAAKNYPLAKDIISKYKANVNTIDKSGLAPVCIVVLSPNTEMLGLLIQNGANLNNKITDKIKLSAPLPLAVVSKNKEIIDILLKSGADVNLVGPYKRTPLHLAVLTGSKDIVQLLKDKGADLSLKDEGGETALDLARDKKFVNIENILTGTGNKQISKLSLRKPASRTKV